jgi:hypothetical protein
MRSQFVHVCKEMPFEMSHFNSDFDAIVAGTYSQEYGGKNIDQYCLWEIRDSRVVNKTAWYDEHQLTLLPDQDQRKAESMIEDYNFGRKLRRRYKRSKKG